MTRKEAFRAVARLAAAACAAAILSAPAHAGAVVARADTANRRSDAAPARHDTTAAGDTTAAREDTRRAAGSSYFLHFPSDSLRATDEPIEISIDDEGVRIDSTEARYEVRLGISAWDEEQEERDEEGARCFDNQFDFDLGLGYQRVDGLSLNFRQDLDHHDWRVPAIHLSEIYSTQQDKWFYNVGIEQRLFSFVPLYVGASVYKITDSNPLDKEIVGDAENALAAFFLKEDFRDYFTRNGSTLHARLELPAYSSVKLEYLDDRYTSLAGRADWSLFRGSATFRPNPAIDEGDMKSVIASYKLDTVDSDKCVPNGAVVGLSVERAGGNLGGDFDFTAVMLDARNYVKLSPYQFLRYHFKLGTRTRGTLPPQREFYVGGIGTLRGHDYKELTGDQMILGNIEYGAYAGERMGLFVFVDSGKAWFGDGGFNGQRLELDAGVGIEFLCHQTQIYAARDVKDPDSPILVGLRLNRTF